MFVQILSICSLASFIFTFPLLSSPLLMGLWVLFVSILISCWVGSLGMTWFGLVLFLVYIGGMLVMFAYFVALSPNQRHSMKVFIVFPLIFFFLFFYLLSKVSNVCYFGSDELILNSTLYFSFCQGPILIFAFVMLFVSLVIVVKVTQRTYGPLRPFS